MTCVLAQSLLYEAVRTMKKDGPTSYYQYRALASLAEVLVVHDRGFLLEGEEADKRFTDEVYSLIKEVQDKSSFKFDSITSRNSRRFIDKSVVARFDEICAETYGHPLGVSIDGLVIKQKKDRTSEDMSDRVEQLFMHLFSSKGSKATAEALFNIWQWNANSSELLYLIRAHLIQAIAEVRGATPFFDNQRLIAYVLQESARKRPRSSSLGYRVYSFLDSLLVSSASKLPGADKSPAASILVRLLTERVDKRSSLLAEILALREEFSSFRSTYKHMEEKINNLNASLEERTEAVGRLDEVISKILIPVGKSLGKDVTANAVKSVAGRFFAQYGIGDIKYAHKQGEEGGEGSVSYSTPSLMGAAVGLARVVQEVGKEKKLENKNSALLDALVRAAEAKGFAAAFDRLFNPKDFDSKVFRTLDNAITGLALREVDEWTR